MSQKLGFVHRSKVEGRLVLGWEYEDGEDVAVAGVPAVPVFLVSAAKAKVCQDQQKSRTCSCSDPNVKPSVVSKDVRCLVVFWVVVEVLSVDSGLYGKIPGAELIAHITQPSKCSFM